MNGDGALMGWHDRLDAGGVLLIDGGTGSELQRRGVPMSAAAWSGTAALTHPEVLRAVHEAYIDAGAEVIITNTFGTARFVLEAAGLGDRFETVNRRAVELAKAARAASGRDVAIAGSLSNLPPNFRAADYPGPRREAAALRELAELLADGGVDLIALEMMQDTEHAPRAMAAALATGLPVWLGVSCRRGPSPSGLVSFDLPTVDFREPLARLVDLGPSAVNVMHSETDAVAPALELARTLWAGPLGVYPEMGDFSAPNWRFDNAATPEELVAQARGWVRAGARILGGCCGTTPEHIRALADALPTFRV